MSDFDQQHADGARRDGYSSSNGGHNGGRTPRPRFTRNHSGERASYGNRGTHENNRNGGYDRQNGYSNSNSSHQGSYNNRTGGYDRQGGYRQNSGSYDRQGGTFRRPSEGFRRAGGNYRQQEGYEGGNYQGGYDQQRGGYTPRPRYAGGNNAGGYGNGGYNRSNQGGYNRGPQSGGFRKPNPKRFNPGKQRIDYKEEAYDPNQPIRLNKFLANAGVCSRRDADKYIQAGVVSVNGEIITELGHKVLRTDTILFHDQQVKAEKKIYVLLNKPKGYVTTSEDPQNRKTVMDLVRNACMERIYPVGRLDRNTTGVLLLTNDGEMASKLTHPKFMKKKIYHVYLDRNVTAADLRQIAEGITLEDGDIRADAVDYASETDRKQVGIEIHSGKNRIVRRIFAALGYNVIKLDRVYFAGLTKKNVKRGDWRFLTEEEVRMLRMGSFE